MESVPTDPEKKDGLYYFRFCSKNGFPTLVSISTVVSKTSDPVGKSRVYLQEEWICDLGCCGGTLPLPPPEMEDDPNSNHVKLMDSMTLGILLINGLPHFDLEKSNRLF